MSLNMQVHKNKRSKICSKTDFFDNIEDIVNWLHKLNIINYTIHEDLVVDVHQHVRLEYCKSFIPVKFGIIHGDFDCSDLDLTSLKGSPREVYGDFNCSSNKLQSLKYCPSVVNGGLNCSHNKLKLLKGSPNIVNGPFCCDNNSLESLLYCTEKVYGNFSCNNNKLISLEHSPKIIYENFYCHHNMLTSLKGCPTVINGSLNCSDNKLNSFDFLPDKIKNSLNINRNCIDKDELGNFNTQVSNNIYSDLGDNEDFLSAVRMAKINKEKVELTSILNNNNLYSQKKRI
ncbi:hypothetical protein PVE54_001075 [Salmonella enterica]|nr:hypothetical protein [Salmonella enterica]